MLGNEEIEKAKGWLSALDVNSEFEASSKEIILSYIEELEEKVNPGTIKYTGNFETDVEQYFEKRIEKG